MIDWKKGEAERGPVLIERSREQTFVSLHHHTTFSYLDGYGMPETHVRRAAEVGLTALAITEHGNVSSHVKLEQAANEIGIKPIFGCELYCGEVGEGATQRKNHLTVLAEDQHGYQNLLRLVSRGWAEGFYYEPTVSGAMLAEHRQGLVVLSGCTGSLLATSLVGGKNIDPKDASYARARTTAQRMRDVLGDAFYLEVQAFPELQKSCAINTAYEQLSQELGIPLVASLDAHYTKPEESEMQAILHNVRGAHRKTLEDQSREWGYDVKLTFRPDDNELYRRLRATGLGRASAEGAIRNTRSVAERCNVVLPKVENLRYPLAGSGADSGEQLFRRWLNDGWQYRNFGALSPDERKRYIERVEYEAELIQSKGFVDYFLVVSDAVKYAKDNGIPVGPARGSAAASLVCYLLRITEVNPMLFPTLLFERFIDANRHDLPDIDLDFDDELRWMVRKYLADKYGEEKVGNIATWTNYKGKNSLDDVARVYRIPEAAVATVKELLIERSSGDLRAAATIEDTIEMFPQVKDVFDQYPELYKAQLLEGNIKGMSVHAAGLVVANGPLSDFCAIYTQEKDGEVRQVVSLDKHDAEYLNVLKLDALGLKTMAAVRIALEHIGMKLGELYATPLDDEETLQGFRAGDVVGIFQFDGRAMRSVNQGVMPETFMEVADVNALARPGPLHSGATAEYIDIKHGRKLATHFHPIVDEITKHTHYQIVYQEQILQVVRFLGNFSWEEAARIRKIISKKRGEQEFNRQRDKFVEGARSHGMTKAEADQVFSLLATAGAYAFNAAHCISYGMLAYWTMMLKRHHAGAFYVGGLRKCSGDKKARDRRDNLMRDLTGKGIPVLPLHMNKTEASWSYDTETGGIRPGFVQIAGVGETTAHAILSQRTELEGFADWKAVQSTYGVGPKTVQVMQDFISDPDPFRLMWLSERLAETREELAAGISDGGPFVLPQPTHTAAEVPYDRTLEDVEVTWLGRVVSRNLKDLFEAHHSRTGQHLDPKTVKRPDLNEWVVMYCEDETDVMVITVGRWRYREFKKRVWDIKDDDLVLVRGIKLKDQARRAIYVTDLWILEEDSGTDTVL